MVHFFFLSYIGVARLKRVRSGNFFFRRHEVDLIRSTSYIAASRSRVCLLGLGGGASKAPVPHSLITRVQLRSIRSVSGKPSNCSVHTDSLVFNTYQPTLEIQQEDDPDPCGLVSFSISQSNNLRRSTAYSSKQYLCIRRCLATKYLPLESLFNRYTGSQLVWFRSLRNGLRKIERLDT